MNTGKKLSSIAIVVACTKRKSRVIEPIHMFRNLIKSNIGDLVVDWFNRLRDGNPVLARDLYVGSGWNNPVYVKALAQHNFAVCSLYVISAGYGYLKDNDPITPYSATFSTDKDQIARQIADISLKTEAHKRWWSEINRQRNDHGNNNLIELNNHDYIFVAVGSDYFNVIQDDLQYLSSTHDTNHLYIISMGTVLTNSYQNMEQYMIPMDTITFEKKLPGARSNINQRALKWLMGDIIPKTSWNKTLLISEIFDQLKIYRDMPKAIRIKPRVSDNKILDWVRYQLSEIPTISNDKLLREFRQTYACERSRFHSLTNDIRHEK